MTTAQQNASQRIYNAAVSGNSSNGGLPSALANILVHQSGNETAGWTSHFFTEYNNCFGYSCVPGAKWQSGCSSGNADNGVKVAAYKSIEDSTQEIVDWIYRRQDEGKFPSDLDTITTDEQYADLLKSAGYYQAPTSNYLEQMLYWAKNVGNLFRTH